MNDFENFKIMLSHGFPSNNNYLIKKCGDGDKIIEKERLHLNGLQEKIIYEQFIFDKDGKFITWQSMLESCKN